MPDSMEALLALLRRCTVRFTGPSLGTGFFVAPGRILTCAHVVEVQHDKGASIDIEWVGKPYRTAILGYRPSPYPDLALLSVEVGAHPCIYLDGGIELSDPLYSWGHTDQYPNGDSATFEYEGPSADPHLLKLREGQVRPGLSGSPLLNRRTGAVCGIVKSTRDRASDLGGRAIPYATLLAELDDLPALQERFHRGDPAWLDCMSPEQRARRRHAVDAPNPFYKDSEEPLGREEEIRRIQAKLRGGNHCSVVGPPFSGKTLLLKVIEREIPTWLGCAPQEVHWINFRVINRLKDLQEDIVHLLGGSRTSELRSLLRHKRLRLLVLDDLGGMDPGERGLETRRWLRGFADDAKTKLLMGSNERLDVLFRKDDPSRDSPLAGLDPAPIELGPLSVETCRRIAARRLEGTGLDPASFSDLFQSPRQPRDLLHAAAARYEALVNARR